MKKIIQRVVTSRPVRLLRLFAMRFRPIGFEGLSLYSVAAFFVEGIQKGALTTRAAAISFRFFLAVFPVLIMLLSLIPIIPIESFQDNLFMSIKGFFPGETFSLVEETVEDLLNKSHNTVFSIGFILSVFYASNSVNAILHGFNESYNINDKGNFLIIRLASVLLMIILGVFIFIAVALIIFSGVAFDWMVDKDFISRDNVILLQLAKWLISLVLIYMSISILYNVGDFEHRKWKTFSAGAMLTTLLLIVTSAAFAWFVNNFASYNKLYGSLGTFLLLLIWINLNSVILLIGFELNTSIAKAKDGQLHESRILGDSIRASEEEKNRTLAQMRGSND
jgi:membrane protein